MALSTGFRCPEIPEPSTNDLTAQTQQLRDFNMPQFTVTCQPPSQVNVGKAMVITAEFTSSNLQSGILYMANLDIVGADGRENSKACSPATCTAVQTPAAGKPQRLSFTFRNVTVRQAGQWRFNISLHSRKDHLGNDFSWLDETSTAFFTAR